MSLGKTEILEKGLAFVPASIVNVGNPLVPVIVVGKVPVVIGKASGSSTQARSSAPP
jgi:hypothetical protein